MNNITPKWAQIATIPTIIFIFLWGLALIIYSFFQSELILTIALLLCGIGICLFAKSFSKLIPFLKLQANLENEILYIKNKNFSGEFPIHKLKLVRHIFLGYVEIFSENNTCIFRSDSMFKKGMYIYNNIKTIQKITNESVELTDKSLCDFQ